MHPARTLATTLAASLLLSLSPPAARADELGDAISQFQERMKAATDAQGKRNAIAEIALKHDPRVAEALKPVLKDKDVDVRAAAAVAIGEQKEPKVAPMLINLCEAEAKSKERSKKLIAAFVQGVGEADAKGQYKFLVDMLRKWLDYSEEVAGAAAKGMGNYRSRETVDDLVAQLMVADNVTTKDSAVKRAARNGTKPIIIEVLQKVTGKDIKEVRVWKDWWDNNDKTWKPAPETAKEADLNAGDTFSDDAYGYMVKKPSKAWSFRKPKGEPLVIEALEEGTLAARVLVQTIDVKGIASKTPEAMADEQKKKIEEEMKDIKADQTEWGKKTRFAGESAVEQEVFGRHKEFDACRLKNVYIVHDGVMYLFRCMWKSGKPEALRDDLDRILASFKFTGK